MKNNKTRRCYVVLPETYDPEIGVISSFLKSLGSQGGMSASIRYALRVAAADLKAKAE